MTSEKKDSTKKSKKNKLVSTQRYLEIASIHDNTVILKNGGLRCVLEVSSVNFNLKSESEQKAIIFSYQRFLNALNFPLQILLRSKKLDIDDYIEDLKLKIPNQPNDLMKNQMREYLDYVKKLVEYADIMEKKFFVVVPQNPLRAEKKSAWGSFLQKISPQDKTMDVIKRRKEFLPLKKRLEEKINVVETGLTNCGLEVKKLSTQSLIELYYGAYNPQLSRTQKLKNTKDLAMAKNLEDNLVVDQ